MNQAHLYAVGRFRVCLAAVLLLLQNSDGSAQTPVEKHPIPSAARHAEIKKLLEETYGLKKAVGQAKKEEAAATLMAAVEGAELSQDEAYVVLITVLNLTKDAGKFESFMDAVGLLGKTYEGDPSQISEKYLSEFLRDCKNNESLKSAIAEGLSVARAAAAENRLPEAMSLLAATESANRRLPGNAATKQSITDSRKWIANREAMWKSFQKATATLLKTPDDPEANWTAGRWHAIAENNWIVALPLLAKGSNAQWKALTDLEMKTSSDNAAQIAVADGWWDLAQNDNSDAKTSLLKHAGEWYARALPGTTALQKVRIEKRLSEIGDVPLMTKTTPLKPAAYYERAVDITPAGSNVDFGPMIATRFADWDADGDLDILLGDGVGYVWILINSGKGKLSNPKRVMAGEVELRVGDNLSTPNLVNMNGDSKPDLVISHSDNQIALFENKGTAKAPQFDGPKTLLTVSGGPLQLIKDARGRIGIGDWDGDGDMDIVAGHYSGPITCYRNVGNVRTSKFADGVPLEIDGKITQLDYNVYPLLFDVDQDGDIDVICGLNWGIFRFMLAEKTPPIANPVAPGMPLIRKIVAPSYSSGQGIDLREIAGDNSTPTIGDFDGDGTLDIVSGGMKCKVWFLRGVSQKSTTPR